ncbi:hypothetical protein KAH55_08080, partial [bacterium]|nr:hypothetical protein [bacterium]
YRFDDVPCPADEFLTHWQASFTRSGMHDLCLTQVTAQGMIYVRRKFMRETTPTGKKNYNLKQNLHATIEERFGISRELVARAELALMTNLEKERELGIWVPHKPR